MRQLFYKINSLHFGSTLAFKKKADGKLSLLDFLVEKADPAFFTFVLSKTNFNWTINTLEFFRPSKRKTSFTGNQVGWTLVYLLQTQTKTKAGQHQN